MSAEALDISNNLPPLKDDPGWTGLNETFKLGVSDLSEKVDHYLYEIDGKS
ncbi:MAG: hypothetical protein BAJALOKI2v1_510028 [Promethearchaeota archaeon]|nr:MAG: hypothetical protein BAJALOKI2v1_510028 [Candidatus Lokiarchaeota archaeon]